ncbi:hypothetical protein BG003_004305 [Podila horticola]|nr:hypothetical protein BG003_004305 [Podila horticola]
MHFNLSLFAMVAIVAPVLAAKTWDVNVVNGLFSPQELDIAPGDTVRWPNTDGDHALVETNPGNRTCNSKAGGFNSGHLTKGQAYQRIFPTASVVNYKDGIGAACIKGATGTIYVGPRPSGTMAPSGTMTPSDTMTPSGTMTRANPSATMRSGTVIRSGTMTRPGPSGTRSAAPISSPTNAANSLSAEKSVLLVVACFIAALAL